MRHIFIILSLPVLSFANPMDSAREEGKSLARKGQSQAISEMRHFSAEELIPEGKRGESFDPEKAKEEAKKCACEGDYTPSIPSLDYIRSKSVQNNRESISENEYFLERSENISQNPQIDNLEIEEAAEYTLETCKQTDTPHPISVIRDLRVDVTYESGEFKEVKVCGKHEYKKKFQHKKDAEKKVKKLRHSLSRDTTIKWYQVDDPKGGGAVHRYTVRAYWEHFEEAQTCNNYQTQLREIGLPREEVIDTWVYENPKLFATSKSPNCTFIKSDCLDATSSKYINGKEISRQCWKEKLTFLCKVPNLHDCPYIKNRNCELIKKECLKEGPYGCSLWELTFKCYSKIIKRQLGESNLYGLDEEPEYELNDSFSEVAAKLAVFDEIKKELEETQIPDARAVQVFKGRKMECGKSIAEEVMYDCCFGYSGLAKELGLKNCNANEIALAEMRENGLCHYVGAYDGKFLDLWKSRDEHVFCCFGSKLAKVLQQNARQQLAISWNDPEHANCRGLSLDEISRLDFTAMDFSELLSNFEKKLPENFQAKLESFENRIKDKVKEHEERKGIL